MRDGKGGREVMIGAWACGGGETGTGLRWQPVIVNVSRKKTENGRQYRMLPLHSYVAYIPIHPLTG